ncbi:MAG TPA: Sec-independent protein translocase protein TatB [Sphingomicrobium sp.]|nr:Sec-independent protein translocase protein TatB [Sphingomicrobium sp.]
MFGIDSTELIVVGIAALIFIGPKELPAALRTIGRWVGKIRGMARHFQTGVEAMIREAELEEMETKWREENERIMREYPALPADSPETDEPGLPLGDKPSPDDTPPAPRPPDARDLP